MVDISKSGPERQQKIKKSHASLMAELQSEKATRVLKHLQANEPQSAEFTKLEHCLKQLKFDNNPINDAEVRNWEKELNFQFP